MEPNILYLAVLPLISFNALGLLGMQEVFTLYASKEFATHFFVDELGRIEKPIRELLQQRTGGHVVGYDVERETVGDGRIILRVTQHVR